MSNRAILSDDVHGIVTIILKHPELVDNKRRFYNCLGLPAGEFSDLERRARMNGSAESYEFFTMCLEKWISNESTKAKFSFLVSTLKREMFVSAADEISRFEIIQNLDSHSKPIWFDVPEEILNFTGRTSELEKLHETITKVNGYNTTVITTISGLGGIGKTSLAIRYAWIYKDFFKNVIWINAQDLTTLEDSFERLSDVIEIDITITKGQIMRQKIASIYKYFGDKNSLFIFDNAESEDELSNGYLPVILSPILKKPYILLTSRNNAWSDKFPVIQLDIFSKEESVNFFQNYLNLETEFELELAKNLSDTLGRFPIAVRQAAAYIKAQKKSSTAALQEYLTDFQNKSRELLKYEYWKRTGDSYRLTTYVTWNVTFEKVKQNPLALALRILRIISVLAPVNIPVELFNNMELETNDLPVSIIHMAIAFLSQYSIITISEGGEMISTHNLVQSVIRDQLNQSEFLWFLRDSMNILERCIGINSFGRFKQIYLVHADTLRRHAQNRLPEKDYRSFERLIRRHRNTLFKSTLEEGESLCRQGKHLATIDLYQEFVHEQYRLYRIESENLVHVYKHCLHISLKLGETYKFLKEYELALKHYDKVINSVKFVNPNIPQRTASHNLLFTHLSDEDIIVTLKSWYELHSILGHTVEPPLILNKILEAAKARVDGEMTLEILSIIAHLSGLVSSEWLSKVYAKQVVESSLQWLSKSSLIDDYLILAIRNPIIRVWITQFSSDTITSTKDYLRKYVHNLMACSSIDPYLLWRRVLKIESILHDFAVLGVKACDLVCEEFLNYEDSIIIVDTINAFNKRFDERIADIMDIILSVLRAVKKFPSSLNILQVLISSCTILHQSMIEHGKSNLFLNSSNMLRLEKLTFSLETLARNKHIGILYKEILKECAIYFSKRIQEFDGECDNTMNCDVWVGPRYHRSCVIGCV